VANFATHFYFSPSGRTGRRLYWIFGVVPLLLAGFLLGLLLGFLLRIVGLPLAVFWLLFGVIGLIGVWSWICIGSRRLHDINQPGWWMLVVSALHIGIAFVAPAPVAPIFSVVVTTVLGAIPGTIGSNAFGADPNATPATAVNDLADA
jgi:uncharacterized membrane protein YhaH (DUF805 family)